MRQYEKRRYEKKLFKASLDLLTNSINVMNTKVQKFLKVVN